MNQSHIHVDEYKIRFISSTAMGGACCSAEASIPKSKKKNDVESVRLTKGKKRRGPLVYGKFGVNEASCDAETAMIALTRQFRREKMLVQKWRTALGFDIRGMIPGCAGENPSLPLQDPGDETTSVDIGLRRIDVKIEADRDRMRAEGQHIRTIDSKTYAKSSDVTVSEKLSTGRVVIFPQKNCGTNSCCWNGISLLGRDDIIRLAAEGIPHMLRPEIWSDALRVREAQVNEPWLYKKITRDTLSPEKEGGGTGRGIQGDETVDTKTIKQIWLDVPRTFSEHPILIGSQGRAEQSRLELFRLMKSFVELPEQKRFGYTQGMNFIAGILWLHIGEEGAFYGMRRLFDSGLRELYKEEFVGLKKLQNEFIGEFKERIPGLYTHLELMQVDTGMYTTSWFLTCFLYNLTLDVVTVVWDVLLVSNRRPDRFLLAFALAVLRFLEERLLKMNFEEINESLIRIPVTIRNIPQLCLNAISNLKQMELKRNIESSNSMIENSTILQLPPYGKDLM